MHERIGLRTLLEHAIDRRSVRVGAWLLRRTKGRIVRLWRRRALVLTVRGRRSGRPRTVVLQYFPDGADLVVVAADSGLPAHPAWYLSLRAAGEAWADGWADAAGAGGAARARRGGRVLAAAAAAGTGLLRIPAADRPRAPAGGAWCPWADPHHHDDSGPGGSPREPPGPPVPLSGRRGARPRRPSSASPVAAPRAACPPAAAPPAPRGGRPAPAARRPS